MINDKKFKSRTVDMMAEPNFMDNQYHAAYLNWIVLSTS